MGQLEYAFRFITKAKSSKQKQMCSLRSLWRQLEWWAEVWNEVKCIFCWCFVFLEELGLSIGREKECHFRKIIFIQSWANQAPVWTQTQESRARVDPGTTSSCIFMHLLTFVCAMDTMVIPSDWFIQSRLLINLLRINKWVIWKMLFY